MQSVTGIAQFAAPSLKDSGAVSLVLCLLFIQTVDAHKLIVKRSC
jgi:hypothetical protein